MNTYKRYRRNFLPFLLLAGLASGCGSEDELDRISDRGGPDSLTGFTWSTDPVEINGITFDFGFRFDKDSVTASNTCNGVLTASATSPVRYKYSMFIPEGVTKEESSGDANCTVELVSGASEFEIVGNQLEITNRGETFVFAPIGSVAGLYGLWQANAPGIGTLIWSMGNGEISATLDCDNGLSASVSASANFTNILDITEQAQDSVEQDGLTCEVSIASGSSEYFFRGADLVMVFEGQEIVLHSN